MNYYVKQESSNVVYVMRRYLNGEMMVSSCNTLAEADALAKLLESETQDAATDARNETLLDIRREFKERLGLDADATNISITGMLDDFAITAKHLKEAHEVVYKLTKENETLKQPKLGAIEKLNRAMGLLATGNSHAQRNVAALEAVGLITNVIRELLHQPGNHDIDDIPF